MIDTEIQDARFCWSKLYLATDVRNFILDEAMGRKGSGICDSNHGEKLGNPNPRRTVRLSSVQIAFFSE
jgi:hypothetical protein